MGIFLLFQAGLSIPAVVFLAVRNGGNFSDLGGNLPMLLLISNTLAAYTTISLERRRQGLTWRFCDPSRASFAWMLLPMLLLTLGTSFLGGTLLEILSRLLPQFFNSDPGAMSELFDLAAHPVSIPLALLIMAPVTEELIFRGLILGGLLRTRPPRIAILLSATLFSVMHLNPTQM